jgi:hypothetical protein
MVSIEHFPKQTHSDLNLWTFSRLADCLLISSSVPQFGGYRDNQFCQPMHFTQEDGNSQKVKVLQLAAENRWFWNTITAKSATFIADTYTWRNVVSLEGGLHLWLWCTDLQYTSLQLWWNCCRHLLRASTWLSQTTAALHRSAAPFVLQLHSCIASWTHFWLSLLNFFWFRL